MDTTTRQQTKVLLSKKKDLSMNMKRLVYLSFGAKFLIAAFFLVLLWVHYLLSQAIAPSAAKECFSDKADAVFNRTASLDAVRREVENYPEVLNACTKMVVQEGSGLTPLMRAAQWVDLDRVKFYLQPKHFKPPYNLNIEKHARNNSGETALHTAVINASFPPNDALPSYDIITLLLDNGAQVNAQDNFLNTSLHMTIPIDQEDRRHAVIDLLIKRGADINAQNNMGVTFMHLAVQNQLSPTIRWFMKKYGDRINPTLRSQDRLNPGKTYTFEELAKLTGYEQVVNAVEEGMKYVTSPR